MVINNIEITNFRCYYGKSSISFNSNGKITLIYGDSGYGKSSLLQFFRWMFYSDPDFGKNDDKPIFNIAAYNECDIGKFVEVSGQIDFEHLGWSYRLNKAQYWSADAWGDTFRSTTTVVQKSKPVAPEQFETLKTEEEDDEF